MKNILNISLKARCFPHVFFRGKCALLTAGWGHRTPGTVPLLCHGAGSTPIVPKPLHAVLSTGQHQVTRKHSKFMQKTSSFPNMQAPSWDTVPGGTWRRKNKRGIQYKKWARHKMDLGTPKPVHGLHTAEPICICNHTLGSRNHNDPFPRPQIPQCLEASPREAQAGLRPAQHHHSPAQDGTRCLPMAPHRTGSRFSSTTWFVPDLCRKSAQVSLACTQRIKPDSADRSRFY